MGSLDHSIVTLRIFGDDLIPQKMSELLGASPDSAHVKGEELVGKSTGQVRIARTGSWRLEARHRYPEDIESQVFEILGRLTSDLAVWRSICANYKVNMFCGLFMASSNDGLELSPRALLALGERGIPLWLDIYDPVEGDASSVS